MGTKTNLQNVKAGYAEVYRGDTFIGWVERTEKTWYLPDGFGGRESKTAKVWQPHIVLFDEDWRAQGTMALDGTRDTRREAALLVNVYAWPDVRR